LIAILINAMKNQINNLHTSLFSKGLWETHGCYCDELGKQTWAEGQTEVFHRATHWCAKNSLHLSDSKRIESYYRIEASGTDTANWTSRHSQLKKCLGQFHVQDDLILSTFTSQDGQFKGYEIMRRLSDSHYTNFGELYFNQRKHSSWSLELRKMEAPITEKPTKPSR
jgi:hypothetical protein